MTIKISDLATEIRESYLPNKDENIPYIGMGDVEQGSLHLSSIGTSLEVESQKFCFKTGDILFGTLRPYFRKLIISPCDGICSTEFSVIRALNPDDQKYIFYSMAQSQFIKYATAKSTGARPRTKWKLFSDFELPKHVQSRRRDIGNFLFNLDYMINNNHQRIKLLEQATRLLYKEWFIHLRFPGHEHVATIDGIPADWTRGIIADLGKIVTGKTPSKKIESYYGGEMPFIKIPDLHGNPIIIETLDSLTKEGERTQANKTLPPRSILVSCIGSVGVVSFNGTFAQTNQQINAIVPKSESYRYWSFFMAQGLKPYLKSIGGGVTMANVNKSKFSNIPVVIPSSAILNFFNSFTGPCIDQIEKLSIMNRNLIQARDLLLPRLLNGEVLV